MAPLEDFINRNVHLSLPPYLVRYVPGQTPLSTPQTVFPALAAYLVTIFGLRHLMKNRPPFKLQFLFQVHNIFLSVGSAILLSLMAEQVLPRVWKHGLFYGICDEDMYLPSLETYYIINYYFKYIELLDTVFLALKKKPLAFLHVYHHSATALLCYSQLQGRTSMSWLVISINLAVHVLMYYYYFATAGGAKIWWKKYLTSMQIIQFIIDLFAVYFGTYSYYTTTMPALKGFPNMGSCAGTQTAALFACALLTSYLGLFVQFYLSTYKKPAKGKKPVANGKPIANGNGVANGHGHKTE